MITKPTVLILGAGASVDFGFPSGGDLKRLLSGVNDLDQDTRTCLEACSFTAEDYAEFSTRLGLSPLPSVDLFLENRPTFARIGKLAIAAKLIRCEMPQNVNGPGAHATWLHELFKRMYATNDRWGENRLTIVTFNHDRVLEHFLTVSLENTFGMSPQEAHELRCRTVRIIHLHGALDDYALVSGTTGRAFTPHMNPAQVECAAGKIRLANEPDSSGADESAQQALGGAEEVVLMGFGYGEENMRRLRLGFVPGKVFGSARYMTERERAIARSLASPKLALDESDLDLVGFLRTYSVMDS